MQTKMTMKEDGKMVLETVKDNTVIIMEIIIEETGFLIKNKEKEY